MTQDNTNIPNSMDENFQKMERLIESFLNTVYQWDTIDPIEVAVFLNILAGKQLDIALQTHLSLQQDQIDAVAQGQVDRYNESGEIDKQTFIGELIGLQRVTGTRLLKLHMMTQDLKTLEPSDPIHYEDLE